MMKFQWMEADRVIFHDGMTIEDAEVAFRAGWLFVRNAADDDRIDAFPSSSVIVVENLS